MRFLKDGTIEFDSLIEASNFVEQKLFEQEGFIVYNESIYFYVGIPQNIPPYIPRCAWLEGKRYDSFEEAFKAGKKIMKKEKNLYNCLSKKYKERYIVKDGKICGVGEEEE